MNKKDYLSKNLISQQIPSFYHTIEIVDSISSTNDELKKRAASLKEGFILISNRQTKGKGRNGRSFYSEQENGIYLSLLLKPTLEFHELSLITALCAVACVDAIYDVYKIRSGIKWVNDIYIEDKKIAGILCESSLKANSSKLDYLVIGIGINVHPIDFPNEIKEIASSIEDFTSIYQSRNELIISFLNHFYESYQNIFSIEYMNKYRNYSILLNETIWVHHKNNSYLAKVIDIDNLGHLHVINEQNEHQVLVSDEISIRKKDST